MLIVVLSVMSTIRDHQASSNVEASYTKDLVVQKGVKYCEGRKSETRGPDRRYNNQLLIVSMPISYILFSTGSREYVSGVPCSL